MDDNVSQHILKTTKEKLEEAQAVLHHLMVEQMAVSATSADGVSIQKQLVELRNYIKDLKEQLAAECSDTLNQWQIRIEQ